MEELEADVWMQRENNILLQFRMQTFNAPLLILIFQAYTNTYTVPSARFIRLLRTPAALPNDDI